MSAACNRSPGQDDLREPESAIKQPQEEEAAQAARGDRQGKMRWHPSEIWEVWVLF